MVVFVSRMASVHVKLDIQDLIAEQVRKAKTFFQNKSHLIVFNHLKKHWDVQLEDLLAVLMVDNVSMEYASVLDNIQDPHVTFVSILSNV